MSEGKCRNGGLEPKMEIARNRANIKRIIKAIDTNPLFVWAAIDLINHANEQNRPSYEGQAPAFYNEKVFKILNCSSLVDNEGGMKPEVKKQVSSLVSSDENGNLCINDKPIRLPEGAYFDKNRSLVLFR